MESAYGFMISIEIMSDSPEAALAIAENLKREIVKMKDVKDAMIEEGPVELA